MEPEPVPGAKLNVTGMAAHCAVQVVSPVIVKLAPAA